MAKFEIGSYAQVIASGRTGLVTERNRNDVTVSFFDVSCLDPEDIIYKANRLRPAELVPMKSSQLGPFVRGELSLEEVTEGVKLLPRDLETDSKAYLITAEDLHQGILAYEGKSVEEIYGWLDGMMQFDIEMGLCGRLGADSAEELIEQALLKSVWENLEDLMYCISEEEEEAFPEEVFRDVKEALEQWLESGGKACREPVKIMIAGLYDCDSIDQQPKDIQRLFKKCLDYCCDVLKERSAIQRRGYCYYCGTKIYPNDWKRARDSFLDYYQMSGDASAANTLGYIYYYGRCNGGVPEYEKAFRYFSIGHAFGYFESTYKLADMLAHGYGVVKDGDSANHLYWGVYQTCLERFICGDTRNKFPDAALRVGNCYKNGIGVFKDYESAYHYYLQADLAIRERIGRGNEYGDTVVFNGIQKALAETRELYTEKGRSVASKYPFWVEWALIGNRRCRLTIKEGKNGVLSLTASPMKRRTESQAPKLLITVPKADYCGLLDKVTIKTAADSLWTAEAGKSELIFDSMDYDWEKSRAVFYLGDDPVGEITTETYTFTAPKKKTEAPSGEQYHFASVRFEGTGRCYDYLCDDPDVKAGDRVVIQGYNGETEVEVVEVYDRYESQLGLPLERYKKIIRTVPDKE